MSAVNVETRNAMATKRADFPTAYMYHHNGLIKSASTSSCSARENALLKTLRASRYATNGNKNGSCATEMAAGCNERLQFCVLQPFSHSEQNMLAAGADPAGANCFHRSHPGAHPSKSFYSNAKYYFGDCAIVGRNCATESGPPSYSSHRNLDNVLVNKNNNSAILNFTSINGYHEKRRCSVAHNLESLAPTAQTLESSHESLSARRKQIRDNSGPILTVAPSAQVPHIVLSPGTPTSEVIQALPSTLQTEATASSSGCATNATSSKACTPEPNSEPSVNGDADEDAPRKLCRRSSSLKMPKESATNPAQKKIVRFADALGLDLADVRTFLDELPSVPKSAYNDLRASSDLDVRNAAPTRLLGAAPTASATSLVPMFKQPGIAHNFVERTRDQNVCLEKAVAGSQPMCSISGSVRVRNIDFHKSVYVRYTLDNWRTFGEVQAVYVPDSCDGFSDQFSFIIYLYELPTSHRVELAIRYHCSGAIYWDNNSGANYVFQASSSPPSIPSYFDCVQTDRCHSFY